MTKLIPILSGRCLVVELPEGATNLQPLTVHQGSKSFPSLKYDRPDLVRGFIDLPPGNWRIIGMLSEVGEGKAEQIVGFGDADPSGDRFVVGHRLFDKEQEEPFLFWRDVTALESLESSILAENWYFENPYTGVGIKTAYSEYRRNEYQSRVLDRSRCLLLGRSN